MFKWKISCINGSNNEVPIVTTYGNKIANK